MLALNNLADIQSFNQIDIIANNCNIVHIMANL